ncbi:uncharacterized protein SI:DKEY-109L4.3 [Latimeria chalumnae]|uniref:uncharacterized protein SI:DKEY-109L4.3 n=1 Tax=Latimeria chalumnae TaxID=7897 RepID=UPI00313BBFA5
MEVENGYHTSVNGPGLSVWDNGSDDQFSESRRTKRKRSSCPDCNGCMCEVKRGGDRFTTEDFGGSFLSIPSNKGVYLSELWKPNGSTLYQPVTSSLMINMKKYDQISFEEGLFFIGDKAGGYLQKEQGHVIHCWRFDEREKKLFIALSFLFTNSYMFQEVVGILGSL